MSLLDTNALLSNALNSIQQQRAWLKNAVLAGFAQALAGTVNANQVFQFVDNLRAANGVMAAAAATPNLAAYAQAQINQPTYDPVADYNALNTDLTNIINWVTTNFPKDTGGFVQAYTLNADGSRTPASFTSTQTAGLLTLVNTAITQLS